MIIKKSWLLSLTLFALPLVSAMNFQQASLQIIDWLKQIFSPFFQAIIGENAVDQYFFARVLFLILIYVICFIALKNIELFKKNRGVIIIVSIIVAILSIRYLPADNFIQWVLLPYGVFATAIVVLLPFMIYFFFVHFGIDSATGRRFAWILFASVFLGLWISRINELGGFSNFSKFGAMNWIYVAGIAGVIASFIFDREIHKYFGLHNIEKINARQDNAEIASLQADRQKLLGVDSEHAKKRIAQIEERLKELGARV